MGCNGRESYTSMQLCHLCVLTRYLYHILQYVFANLGLAYSAIKTYLSAIRHLHIANELPEPTDAQVGAGGERHLSFKISEPPQGVHLPITLVILQQLRSLRSPRARKLDMMIMWASCCTDFFKFFWIGELTVDSQGTSSHGSLHCMVAGDVAIDDHHSPSVIKTYLRHSKAD